MSDPQTPVEASLGLTILCALETALGMPTNLEMPTDALAAALRDAISREFLVVPRSDIVGKDFFVLPVEPPGTVPDAS